MRLVRSALLALSASLLLALQVSAQVNTLLAVLTQDTQAAIVTAGIVNPAWLLQSPTCAPPACTGPFAAPQESYPSFVMSLDASAPAGTTQGYTLTYTSSDNTIVTMSSPTEQGTVVAGQQSQSEGSTQCVSAGNAQITVTLELNLPAGTTLTWAYTKTCTLPLVSVGSAAGDRDVVASSVAVAEYADWIVSGDTVSYYMFLDNPVPAEGSLLQPFLVKVDSAAPADVFINNGDVTYNTTYPGGAAPTGYALYDVSKPVGVLTIPFTCAAGSLAVTQTVVTVTLTLPWTGTNQQLSYSFVKQCLANSKLLIMDIGTTPKEKDISKQGVVQDAYATAAGHVFTPNTLTNDVFSFYMCLGCTLPTHADDITFNATYDVLDTSIYDVVPIGWTNGVVQQNEDASVHGTIVCKAEGTATTRWQLRVGPHSQFVEFAFQYQCVMPLINVGIDGPTTFAAQKSVVMPAYNNGKLTYASAVSTTRVFLYLDASNDQAVLPAQYYSLDVVVDTTVLDVEVSDPNKGNAPYLTNGYLPIQVDWKCKRTQAASPVLISLRYGWDGLHEMELRVNKDCSVEEEPSHKGPWTPAGIFFFTMFLLGLTMCLAGCAWNYRAGKTGWEIVPLYVSAVRAVDKCRGTNQPWSPQMDSGSSSGGARSQASYGNFDDNGYQNNL